MRQYQDWDPEERSRYHAALLERINSPEFFANHIGVHITRIEDGAAEGEMLVDDSNCNSIGTVHGGSLFTLADTVSGMSVFSQGYMGTTISSTMDFLRPGKKGMRILARGEVQKLGRTVSVVRVSLREAGGRMLATGLFTFCMVGPLNWDGERILD